LNDDVSLECVGAAAHACAARHIMIVGKTGFRSSGLLNDYAYSQFRQRFARARHQRHSPLSGKRFPRHTYGQSHELPPSLTSAGKLSDSVSRISGMEPVPKVYFRTQEHEEHKEHGEHDGMER
jgi:hypothetical protein